MQNKVLTISIAAYNVESTLSKAIESIVSQNNILRKIEIIIENDGSSDQTKKIANKYQNDYPETIVAVNKENGGYGSTINNSIKIAKGKYFKHLDGDDWFETKNLEPFLHVLEKVDTDLVYSPFYYVNCLNQEKTLSDTLSRTPKGIVQLDKCYVSGDITMHSLAIKTEFLRNNNIVLTEKCFYTDFEYVFYSFVKAKTLYRFKDPIYCYLLGRDGQSVSIQGEKAHYKDRITVVNRMAKSYEINRGYKDVYNKEYIDFKILQIVGDVYNSILIAIPEPYSKNELIDYDSFLKVNYPRIYQLTSKRRNVCLLRNLKFSFIARNLVRQKVVRRYKNF